MTGFVFHDPSGLRARRAGIAASLAVAALAALVAAFFATLAIAPNLPTVQLADPHVLSALHQENARHWRREPTWTRVPRQQAPGGAGAPAKPLTVAFYVSWDERSRQSLRDHLGQVDVVSPEWIALDADRGAIAVAGDPQAQAIIDAATHHPSVLPIVHNVRNEVFDGPEADRLLTNPQARALLLSNLDALAKKRGFAGYVFDFEALSPAGLAAYPGFIAEARGMFHPQGREVWLTAPFADRDFPLAAMRKASDTVVLMAYDEHWGAGEPGPLASQGWYEQALNATMAQLDPAHTILALGAYGYDWTLPAAGQPGRAEAVTFNEATAIARDSQAEMGMDEDTLNPTFDYKDDAGRAHSVWFLDGATLFNQIKVSDAVRPRGYALWRMGSEDPGVWSLLGRPYGQASTAGLNVIAPGDNVEFDGTGEVLSVAATPKSGHRTLKIDPAAGLITAEDYDVVPTAYVLRRYGARPGYVALTFDDGPDPRWTPKILDILKAKHAPATFFVIGANMEDHPELVRREVDEGNIVGNHTFTHPNIAETPGAEATIELNATQRLFEVVTGRSMRLFRPPYFGDAEPSTPAEVAPLVKAQNEGYLTVGLRIDPDDWKRPDPQLIVQRALARLADKNPETGGQIVLLHDSGGDRRHTIEALPHLIDALRAHGYTLVTVPQLAGMTASQAMPVATRGEGQLMLDRIGFGFFHGVQVGLRDLFITAIALGVGRLVFLAGLALTHRLTARRPPEDPDVQPLVSVLIPCFNEEKVIAASVARILASDWPNLEVLVIDDGSSDGTSRVVAPLCAADPRVRLLRLENGGKATALNAGLKITRGDIVVALDADTLFPPRTIRRLVRWFADSKVGAVAGNAMVGNRKVNLLTRWQALEYVVAQNLERRALAALGAVTVVPGAVGAWRRSALLMLGGYPADTLAEDQDLTLAVQRAGWQVAFDPSARAYTEAPSTVSALLKQRFRWSFGTLQCLWKQRGALFDRRRPVLGFIALPQIWLFQIILAVVAPLVDLAVVASLISTAADRFFHPIEWSPDNLVRSGLYWAAFVLVDLSAAALGMAFERKAPWADLIWLPVQRFGYRQMMYYVVVRSLLVAVRGRIVGWGVQTRQATAVLEAAE